MSGIKFRPLIFFLLPILFVSSSAPAQEENSGPRTLSSSVKTYSRLVTDPGKMDDINLPLFQTGDGSSLEGVTYEAGIYETVTYSKTIPGEEMKPISDEAKDFFKEEKKRRLEFFSKVRNGEIPNTEINAFRREELKRRREFAQKQQIKIDEINCKGLETTPACKKLAEKNKTLLDKLKGILIPLP